MTDLAAYAQLSSEIKKCTACPFCTTRNEVVVDLYSVVTRIGDC